MLIKRIKYAGDIFEALVKQCEWDIDTASAFLESIPDAPNASLRPNGEWISVEDRLPKAWEDVLVLLQCGDCIVAVRSGKYWRERWCHSMLDRPPTHWMPLPEPPNTEATHDS